MIFITARFPVKPEHADDWPRISREFTEATRAEEGCLWFDWSRSLDDPTEYVLVEAFRDDEAGGAHVRSEHFARATAELPAYLSRTPRIVNVTTPGEEWAELGEMAVG
ncbi:putative quinol monooxygenase [Phycicoccus ginsengisoli]